ncbi:MAG TPA: EamA family transporter [Candidatus Udaeobacter sp.]|nr:EamA family transporter [Candidatus Udaeobacter sp.]
MTSPVFILILVLLAAILHACWNALVKIGGDRQLAVAMVVLMTGVVALPLLPFAAIPASASWPFIIGSVSIHIGYYYGLTRMYETGEFSLVYPLARGLSPLFVALGAAAFGGEALGFWQLLGVSLVSIGIVSLMFGRGWPRGDHARAILFALFTCLTIVLYSLIDGFGVRRSHSSLGYIAWLFVVDGFPFVVITWRHRGNLLWTYVARHWQAGLGAAVMSTLAYGIVIWAMSQTAMAGVVSLRETSVVFAAAIGSLFMGESFGPWRIAAAVLVATGNVLIHL